MPDLDMRPLRTPVSEKLLIDALGNLNADRTLTTTSGRGQFAAAVAAARPNASITCHVFDAWQAEQTKAVLNQTAPSVQVHCAADFPSGEIDLFALPVDMQGEAELTRDLLQAGHQALVLGGTVLASTNNPGDRWLGEVLEGLFDKVRRTEHEGGAVYQATKSAPLKKVKRYECEFAFRDEGRLIKAISRPGVFSHRSLDAGARALINSLEIRDGDHVLDLGCGSGVVGFAAAFRAADVRIESLDSHARAIECTARGAALNGLTSLTARLSATAEIQTPDTFDVVAANPPYYSSHRIAEIFLQAAATGLRSGGLIYLVTKSTQWYDERMPQLFQKLKYHPQKSYTVIEARKG